MAVGFQKVSCTQVRDALPSIRFRDREQGVLDRWHVQSDIRQVFMTMVETSREVYVGTDGDDVLGYTGYGLDGEDTCIVWFVGTTNCLRYNVSWVKVCRLWLDQVTNRFKNVLTSPDIGDDADIKYLRMLGFEVDEVHESGFLIMRRQRREK